MKTYNVTATTRKGRTSNRAIKARSEDEATAKMSRLVPGCFNIWAREA